ncbi:hypothetical protein DPQ33_04225 [Oceanidesulfovibrio indonesiensis]|uniref:Uncharacterized protein n=1 Tax=Oceanidesulfovibrio indonesiensis TaxID=54767 RepID=A0A7M3MHG5_9BACT|nr:hypothetical protein [Oceanidesulfovibrio indonesiensis]TVM18690.1 hypothetical protein DPQ33_04225 [Oceanidesulfovibrio indonesiensis]
MIKVSLGWLHFAMILGKGMNTYGDVEDVWFRVELSYPMRMIHITLPFLGSFFYAPGANLPPAFSR